MEGMESLPEFVGDTEQRFLCVLCSGILREPMQTICGHRLCRACVQTLVVSGGGTAQCPAGEEDCEELDMEPNTLKVVPDMCCRRDLLKLPVQCSYRHYGCQEQIAWGKLQNHKQSCIYNCMQDCGYREQGCRFFLKQDDRDMVKHMAACEFRPQVCTYCAQQVPGCRMEDHQKQNCSQYPLPCPHGCELPNLIPRDKLQDHLQSCVNIPVPCRYHRMGCTFVGKQSEVAKHVSESMEDHLVLVTEHSAGLESECRYLKDRHQVCERHFSEEKTQWKSTEKDLHSVIQKKDKENDQLRAKVDHQTNMMQQVQRMVADQRETVYSLNGKNSQLERQVQWMESQMTRREADLTEKFSRQMSLLKDVIMEMNKNLSDLQGLKDPLENDNGSPMSKLLQQEAASYNGILEWKIRNYSIRKAEAANGGRTSFFSQPFYTGRQGYKMCAKIYLNGDRARHGTHVSLYFALMKGEYDGLQPTWPFTQKVALMICDHDDQRNLQAVFNPNPRLASFQRPRAKVSVAKDYPLCISHDVLESAGSSYIRDDSLYVKVVVDTSNLQVPRHPLPLTDESTESSDDFSD